jgi:hypothetical protein
MQSISASAVRTGIEIIGQAPGESVAPGAIVGAVTKC